MMTRGATTYDVNAYYQKLKKLYVTWNLTSEREWEAIQKLRDVGIR